MQEINGTYSKTALRRKAKRIVSIFMGVLLTIMGITSLPTAALAAQNTDIAVDQVQIGAGTGPGGQLTIGDKILVTGEWDARGANPQPGQEFVIGLPQELSIPANVTFSLEGPNGGGGMSEWATCTASVDTGNLTCTLTDAVETYPENVHGGFEFEVEAVAVTDEESVIFDLNGDPVPVPLPGGGGIDDGVILPTDITKNGSMNGNNWSMSWEIQIPGAELQGHSAVTIEDKMNGPHALCQDPKFTVDSFRGDTHVESLTNLFEYTPSNQDTQFTGVLEAPDGGFDEQLSYVITYQSCADDNKILDPDDDENRFDNTAEVFLEGVLLGEGVGPTLKPNNWKGAASKTGSVLGGEERDGKIRWTIEIPGDELLGKNDFTFADSLDGDHEVCEATLSGLEITERYGPSSQLQQDLINKLDIEEVQKTDSSFELKISIADAGFEFKPSDYRYRLVYETCVTTDGLPKGGTEFSNKASIDGEITDGSATVKKRTENKKGNINDDFVTLDGVEHYPQTTIAWEIILHGELLKENNVSDELVLTDIFSGTHQVCPAGDPSGGLQEQLGLLVEARDQIKDGGLDTVNLTGTITDLQEIEVAGEKGIELTIPEPELEGTVGFSKEYQYVIKYTTCTTSGGMDAPETEYGNDASFEGWAKSTSVQQKNRGSGTGTGVARGSVEVHKSLQETLGAAFVPAGTEFTVHVKEISPDESFTEEYDITVPLDGSASGINSRGLGWTVELSEATFPNVSGVMFGDPVFEASEGVTPSADGKTAIAKLEPGTNIEVALKNEALLGSVTVLKELEGEAAEAVDPDKVYDVTAHIDTSGLGENVPEQQDRSIQLQAGETRSNR